MEGIKKLPSLDFGESVKKVLNNLTNFNGRARRSELWWYYLLYFIATAALFFVVGHDKLLQNIITIALQLTLWSVTARRLHDRGQGGWWVTLSIALSIFSICYMYNSGYYEAMAAVNPDIDEAMSTLRSPIVMVAGVVSFIVNICIFIFCVLDSKPEANKYGPSPKYIPLDEYIEKVTGKQA